MINRTIRLITLAFASFFYVSVALAQGTVTNHAIAIGKGAGVTGFSSALCTSAQLLVGQSAADPLCKTITGDVTIDATGATAIGAGKVTNAMLAGSIAFSKLIGTDITSLGTVTVGTWSASTIALNKGGTGQTTAPAARGSSGLNVESFTGHGDSIYTILATDRVVGTNAAFTASRTWTLPAANAVNAGQCVLVADFQGTVTGVNTLVVARAGSDTINGGTSVTISSANGGYILCSDGSSKWTAQSVGPASGGGSVTSVVCGATTITTTGTCYDNSAWSTFTPAFSCNAGSVAGYTTQTGRYKTLGKTVWIQITMQASGAGTCSGGITITGLPVTSGAGRYELSGYDFSGGMIVCDWQTGTTQCLGATATNGNLTSTHINVFTGVAETN